MVKVYITNLGKYNEGYLIGKWVELPASDEKIEEVLKEIGINEEYEEYFITDYECDMDGIEINEYSSIDELNRTAEIINELDEDEIKICSAIMENENCSIEEAIEKKDNRLIITLDKNTFNDNINLAENYIEQIYGDVSYMDKETLARYFDFESFGRDLAYDFFIDNEGTMAISSN